MNDSQSPERKPSLESLFDRLGGWRMEVEVRRGELEDRVRMARAQNQVAQSPPLDPGDHQRHVDAIDRALGDAAIAIGSKSTLRSWLTGGAVTMAWESVHVAEGELVEIERADSVRSALPRLLTWIQEVMGRGSLRERYEKQLGDFIEGTVPLDRTVVRQAYGDVLVANNERHASLRAFRNVILGATVALLVLLLGLALWHAADPGFVSLCGHATAPGETGGCLGGATSQRPDLFEVELVGAMAGLLSVAFGLGSARNAPSRYNVRAPQAALKPVAGAATALIGVLLVQSHILIAPAQTTSEALLLAYAAIFGFSQQLLTQVVDKRAGKLLGTESAADEGETKK